MKASIDWLNDFVDLQGFSPQEIAEKLTMVGLEVEDLSNRFAFLNEVVSARIETAEPMEDNERIKLCQVDAGSFGRRQIICAAPNAKVGLVAPLALPGLVLPNGLEVGASKVYGHMSEGMLCSELELALGSDGAGLMVLDAEPGRRMSEINKREDWVMEIGITPNRPDALSIIGLARDLSALLDRPLRSLKIDLPEDGPDVASLAEIIIEDPEHCGRFTARIIRNIEIGPSPDWLMDRLASVGLRSINNIVDITNYVMIEMGQPLHAYDLDRLAGQKLITRVYPKGEHFTTLDGQKRELSAEANLMICDGEKAVGLAGIMGGLNSEIENSTRNIMLEGAYFNATTIRKTSRTLGLSTDASYRFERGCDPEICALAVDRAISLMKQLAGGSVARGIIDVYPKVFKAPALSFSPSRCNAYLGTKHKDEDMIRVLKAIGFKSTTSKSDFGQIILNPPSWRPDVFREVDVWEEVARLLDFENLPATLPKPPINRQEPPLAWTLRAQAREHLMSRGFAESITYSFINKNYADKLNLPKDSPVRLRILPIMNPLSEEQGVLRSLMAPSLINALRGNQSQGQQSYALYELGAIFLSNGLNEQPNERLTFGGVWGGEIDGTWLETQRPVDFWDIKGVVEGLAEHLNLDLDFYWDENLPPWYDISEAAYIKLKVNDRFIPLGHLGRLDKKVAKAFGLKEAFGAVYLFELDAQVLLDEGLSQKKFSGWSKFPPNQRDMALVLDSKLAATDLLKEIKNFASAMPLTDINIFDLYQGQGLPEGRKSLAFRLNFQSMDRTLNDDEVSGYFNEIAKHLAECFKAELRS